jgi:hypothetical protein
MSDDERRTRPPSYADPIVLRMRFVPRATAEKPFPTHVASKAAWAGHASSDDLAEAVRRAGYGHAPPAAPVRPCAEGRGTTGDGEGMGGELEAFRASPTQPLPRRS